jgi:tetratricopeptide (TPR) repeat protein
VDKYGAELQRPTIVEIFADQRDFAVRTFGVPDVPGYLGVCFGRVVTANSPATTGSQAVNWEAVLWHEFCHVVTLQLTRNKMPRWLSEGISVYEERQASPVWGERMNPRYRDMILAGQLTPVSHLSSAFLAPRSPLHLQFAYYQSSLVVEFIVERFGLEALKSILVDLRDGEEINRAIADRTTSMANVEREFAAYAKARAEALGPGLDWEKPDEASVADPVAFARWARNNPGNYWAILWEARERASRKEWEGVKELLVPVIEKYPDQAGNESAYRLLAEAHRSLGDTEGERGVLAAFAEVDGGATDVYLRLMELAEAEADWPEVARNARRFLAVNPLVAPPYRRLGQASAETGDLTVAIDAYRVLLELNPTDPADVHYHLALWLQRHGDTVAARRHALLALEEAPRYREALKLLQTLVRQASVTESAPAESPSSFSVPTTLPPVAPLSL